MELDYIKVKEFYLDQNHSQQECLKHFGVGQTTFNDFLSDNNLKRSIKKHRDSIFFNLDKKQFLEDYYNSTIDNQTLTKKYNLNIVNPITKAADYFGLISRTQIFKEHKHQEATEYYINNKKELIEQISSLSLLACSQITGLTKKELKFIIKKYNLEHSESQIRNKHTEATKILKYGDKYYNNNNKTQQTNYKKYGTVSPLNNKDVIYKIRETKLKKYNNPYYCNSDKAKQTKLSKYGYAGYNNATKAQQTCLTRYGTKTYSQTEESKIKVKQTNNALYGVDALGQLCFLDYSPIYKKLYYDGTLSKEYLETHPSTCFDLAKEFNCSLNSIYMWSEKFNLNQYIINSKSHYEEELKLFLHDWGIKIETNKRDLIPPYEIDIYCPDYNIGIEFNGTYWHSSLFKDKNYHFNKAKLAETKNIRLIQIWEYEWVDVLKKEKILALLKTVFHQNQTIIYARKCSINKITNQEAKPFNEANHLQGHRNAQITYGLFYKEKLVQLMSFSRTKYNRNLKDENSWEIIRGCPGSNNVVIGGVSKLFKQFVKDYSPKFVFSYCDFNKFDGIGYTKIGMEQIGYTGPDKKYLINRQVINRNPKQYKTNKTKSEAYLWGAGSIKFIWKPNMED